MKEKQRAKVYNVQNVVCKEQSMNNLILEGQNGNLCGTDDTISLTLPRDVDREDQHEADEIRETTTNPTDMETAVVEHLSTLPADRGSDNDEKPDEESTLISSDPVDLPSVNTYMFEPPYTAPLAPLDMELFNHQTETSSRHSLERNKRIALREFRDSERRRHSRDHDATTMFISRERLNSGADDVGAGAGVGVGADAGAGDGDDCSPADRWNQFADSEKPLHMTHFTNSTSNDSAATTLLLSDGVAPQIVHNHSNRNKRQPKNTRTALKNLSIPMTETQLAPFETPEDACSCPRDYYQRGEPNPSLFFEDGRRSIDFVLAYKVHLHPQTEEDYAEKRRVFETNLELEGLEIERVVREKEQIYFVKIHAPLEVLRRYAEILKLRMPMKELICNVNIFENTNRLRNAAQYISRKV